MVSPLSGIRVLDLTSCVAGPYCTKILADYGADVIKVEPPDQGDVSRQLGTAAGVGDASPLFLHLNTNKRSITLDITTEAGGELLKRLIGRVALVVDDGALATAAGNGWAYDALSASNEPLVMTSITPFGPDGPYQDYRATDIVLTALGGWMFPMGDPDRPPLQPGGPYVAYVAGLWAAVGTLTAFYSAAVTGLGQQVHISMLEATAATTVEDMVRHSFTGEERGRHGHRWGPGVYPSLQPCSDGSAVVMGGPNSDQVYTLLDLDPPADGERLGDDELEAQLRGFVGTRSRDEIFHAAQALRLPFAPVATPEDVLQSPQLNGRHYFDEVAHQQAGRLRYTGAPYLLSETPATARRPAPALGQDNEHVYVELAEISPHEIASLERDGVI